MPLRCGASTRSQLIPSLALEAAPVEGRGAVPVILSLLNISTETQAQSRLAVLCREVVGGRSVSGRWHQAYRLSLSIPTFGLSATRCAQVTRGGRMLALPLPSFTAAADPRANAKQEGIP